MNIVRQLNSIGEAIASPHTLDEILNFIQAILMVPSHSNGRIVEAGCYKGSGTAKFSLAAELAGRELVVFDSFRGIPANDERHDRDIFGTAANFQRGAYCGTLGEVTQNVTRFGRIGCCRFIEGWFEDTMPTFGEPIAAAYLDVDLASSTRTCLKYLYPLLEPGGVLFSQDGHLPLVIDVFDDDGFWRDEVGSEKPAIEGLRKRKLIRLVKPLGQESQTSRVPARSVS
jgi:O-methyltransferase